MNTMGCPGRKNLIICHIVVGSVVNLTPFVDNVALFLYHIRKEKIRISREVLVILDARPSVPPEHCLDLDSPACNVIFVKNPATYLSNLNLELLHIIIRIQKFVGFFSFWFFKFIFRIIIVEQRRLQIQLSQHCRMFQSLKLLFAMSKFVWKMLQNAAVRLQKWLLD